MVGKTLALGGEPYTVIGVLGPDFAFDPPADLYLPFQADTNSTNQGHYFQAAGLLRPGITLAQANAQIGVARAAYYPTVTLSAAAGFASTSFTSWFTWPSRLWSVGPGVSETIFDGGLRRATVQQYRAAYDQATANYRETVLTAFQQIEDNLASLRLLSKEIEQQETAVKSAQRNLALATDRYRLGIDPYLNVITAQTTLLSNQQTDVNLHVLQMTATVQLIEALGGGWDNSQLPSPQSIAAKTP